MRHVLRSALAVLSAGFALGTLAFTYLTNPFTRFTIVRPTFAARVVDGTARIIDRNDRMVLRQGPLWRLVALFGCGVHVLTSRYVRSPRAVSDTVDGIVADIHRLRFDPDRLLLISGDHFTALFVRNLGVFYYPVLDRAIPGTAEDWHDRETTYLQTLGYALGAFDRHELTTTVVSTGRHAATCVNIYAYPSDTLYAMLYALAALRGDEPGRAADYAEDVHPRDTTDAAAALLARYGDRLAHHYRAYRETVLDAEHHLVTPALHMSGAKDITRRRSAFYDNVAFWKTTQLAATLGLTPPDQAFLDRVRAAILERFWLEDEGYFLEDLSAEGIAGRYYSSDWLIVLATGFLDPAVPADRVYLERTVAHVRASGVARPFAIKYQNETRAHRQFPVVRLAVPSYGGDAIWSFWGMEYVKTLVLLHRATGRADYLEEAGHHLREYSRAMLRDGGFPEVYDADGALLTTPLYRSIRQTGWVIGFEQAREMYRAATAAA